jgi:mono/diheme cytochrome c family protein
MNKKLSWAAVLLAALLFVLQAGCSRSEESAGTLNMERPAPPAPYAGKVNPLTADAAAEAGKQLYAANCTSCHGPEGMADGPAAGSLNPKPKPLAVEMKALKDDYLYWRIAEGGAFAPFTSAMPSWKSILSEEEIWQVIAFMRTLAN